MDRRYAVPAGGLYRALTRLASAARLSSAAFASKLPVVLGLGAAG